VAKTYKRGQLAESVLLPNKSIAQGFVTYLFVLDNGTTVTGFVTSEGPTRSSSAMPKAARSTFPSRRSKSARSRKSQSCPKGR